MPDHEEVLAFAEEMRKYLPHDVLRDVPASRVAMLARDSDTWVPKLQKSSDFWERDPITE
jgi:tRNA wybutosine-synthesizing protein 1